MAESYNKPPLAVFRAISAVIVALAIGCAHTPTERLRVAPSRSGPVSTLADLTIQPGTECVLRLKSGQSVRGVLLELNRDSIALEVEANGSRSTMMFSEADLVSIGQVVGMSKPQRGWIGAGLGALASLPLSISMIGDAMLIGGALGALIGRSTGDSYIEIVLQR